MIKWQNFNKFRNENTAPEITDQKESDKLLM